MKNIEIGMDAPQFEALDQDGKTISLGNYKGKKVALYFYPRDMTPTCTTQACNFRDHYADLKAKGIEVIGVSDDNADKHQKFISKHKLPFTLLADTDHQVLEAYGVWGPKKFMGKVYDGTHRKTFLIDEEQKVVGVVEKVKAKIHSDQVLEGFGLK